MTVCKRVLYSGTVQGVGFRYTARRLAEGRAVSGYVRNLPGGDVELVAQGEAAEVEAFLTAVARQMAGCIAAQTIQDEPPGAFQGFGIRR
jgi:acylphosphatase